MKKIVLVAMMSGIAMAQSDSVRAVEVLTVVNKVTPLCQGSLDSTQRRVNALLSQNSLKEQRFIVESFQDGETPTCVLVYKGENNT